MTTIRREFIQAHRFIYGSTAREAAAAYDATPDHMIHEIIQLYRTHNRLMKYARQQLQTIDVTCIDIDDAPPVDSSTQPRQEAQEAPQAADIFTSAAVDAITAAGYTIESITTRPQTAQEAPTTTAAPTGAPQQERPQEGQEGPQERPQRVYRVYFTDAPEQPTTVKARTKTDAKKAANLYRRQWGITASIDRIERDEGELMPF